MIKKIMRLCEVFSDAKAWRAICTWRKFSFTSFLMVRRLQAQGIVPKTVIDVGANSGQFSVASLRLWQPERLFAFEPQALSVMRLKNNVGHEKGVSIYSCALGEKAATVQLNVNSHSHSSSLRHMTDAHRQAFPASRDLGQEQVSIRTLDEVLRSEELAHPILLKLDVQGYEREVLMGAEKTLAQIDYIVIETSFRPMYDGELTFNELNDVMKMKGFVFVRPVDFLHSEKDSSIVQMDVLFQRVQ
jgi:FkbM family methyltransferase